MANLILNKLAQSIGMATLDIESDRGMPATTPFRKGDAQNPESYSRRLYNVIPSYDLNYADDSAIKPTNEITKSPEEKEDPKINNSSATINNNSEIIKSFQQYFSQTQAFLGKLYSGPIDGKINQQIIQSAQQAENKLQELCKDQHFQGKIWNGKSFSTSVNDLQTALELISKSNKNNKSVNSTISSLMV